MKLKTFAAALLAALMMVPAVAGEEKTAKKKGQKQSRGESKSVAAMMLKRLEPVGLTESQIARIKELGAESTLVAKTVREDAGITPELMKKRAAALKAMKGSGKKGKDLIAAINQEAGLTESQATALVKIAESRKKFHNEVMALLTDEQKEKLPQQLQRASKAGERQAKAKGEIKKRQAEGKTKADLKPKAKAEGKIKAEGKSKVEAKAKAEGKSPRKPKEKAAAKAKDAA